MQYSKYTYNEVIAHQSEPKSLAYKLGFILGADADGDDFFNLRASEVIEKEELWWDFRDGMRDKISIIAHKKFNELNLAGFTYELKLLCKRYNVIAKDNSCCDNDGDVFVCNDVEFFASDVLIESELS
jgi:hypothetical protein